MSVHPHVTVDTLLCVIFALLTAASNAGAAVLQRKAAAQVPAESAMHVSLMKDLVRRRVWLAGIALVAVAAVLNRWIRLSLHLAFAVYCGLVLAKIHFGYGLPILLLAPLLAWSRLVLLRHTLPEVIGGSVLGLGAAAILIGLWPQG